MIGYIDRGWKICGQNAGFVSAIYLVIGIALSAMSAMLGLADVSWNGNIAGTMIDGFSPLDTKQVGFLYAPNWAFASIVLMPLAILNLLNARGGIEDLIKTLVRRKMLISTRGEVINETNLLVEWSKESTRWSFVCFLLFLFMAMFTMYVDFYDVVWQWNMSPSEQLRAFAPLHLSHPRFEFDWSVASIFDGATGQRWAKVTFSLIAYILIPVCGAGFLLSGFVWFLCFCTFFSRSSLRRKGMVLVPDTTSTDEKNRVGFENFEEVFDHLVQAAIFTALLALVMHLQNVFLRSPTYATIIEMVFDGAIKAASELVLNWSLMPILTYLTTIQTVLDVPISGVNFQVFISALAMILLAAIVVGSIWMWLRRSAIDGKRYLIQQHDLSEAKAEILRKMNIWPVGWISLNLLISIMFIVFMSMYVVNLVALIIFIYLIHVVGGSLWSTIKVIRDNNE